MYKICRYSVGTFFPPQGNEVLFVFEYDKSYLSVPERSLLRLPLLLVEVPRVALHHLFVQRGLFLPEMNEYLRLASSENTLGIHICTLQASYLKSGALITRPCTLLHILCLLSLCILGLS